MKKLIGKRAVLYRRVSTKEQKDKGSSLETQQERLHEFCNRHEIEIIKDFSEDYSAKNINRPVFSKLIEFTVMNKNNIDLLLIHKWDRFSRNALQGMTIVDQLKGMNIEVNSSEEWINHEDPNQQIMYMIHVGLPEVDNRQRSYRTILGTRSNLKEGRWVHSQPKGYVKGRDELDKVLMKPDPKISHLITELFKDYSLGIYSQNQIIKFPKFKPLNLTKSNISRILNQIVYSGRIRVKAFKNEPEQIVDALHKPLISVEVFEKVQYELGNRKRIKHKPKKQNELLPLRGFLKCNCCESNLTGSGSRSQTGKKHYYYHCNPRKGCKERFNVKTAHSELLKYFEKIKPNKEVLNLFEKILIDKFENSEISNKKLKMNLDTKISTLVSRKDKLLEKYLDELVSDDIYQSKNKELGESIHQLKIEKGQIDTMEKDTVKFVKFGVSVLNNLGLFFKKSSINTQQSLISSIFKGKLVFDGTKYRTPILNKGIDVIYQSINQLDVGLNKNRRLSYDNLPLCTRDGT